MNNEQPETTLQVARPGLRNTILYGVIIAILMLLLGEVIQLRLRIDRVYDQVDELDRTITKGAMTGKIGEEVR